MTTPICPICGTAMLYIPCPCLQPRCSVAHYSCPNGPEDSPYHKLFLELVAVRKIVFEYKERIAELEKRCEMPTTISGVPWPTVANTSTASCFSLADKIRIDKEILLRGQQTAGQRLKDEGGK